MDEISLEDLLAEHKSECEGAIASFKRDLQTMRTGRASTSMLEGLMVDYYGTKTALSHLGQISSPEPRQLLVQVYDNSATEIIEKAIRSADFGFNPQRDGNTLRITVPQLTEDSRKEIVKHLHKVAEDIRISIRNHRRDSNDMIKLAEKEGQFTKDDSKRAMDQVQKQTDQFVSEVDSLLKAKEQECMQV